MEFEAKKLDAMFLWLNEGLKAGEWFPQGNRSLSEMQIAYIEELLRYEYPCFNNIEINNEKTKVRKDAFLNCKSDQSKTSKEIVLKLLNHNKLINH